MKTKNIILTLVTTLIIIVLANVWAAKTAEKRHLLSSIPTALIDGYVAGMEKGYDIWFIGNSTLDNGVVIKQVEKGTGKTILKTPLGSATAEAMSLLAAKGLGATQKLPSDIYMFITKDDLNAKGLRGETSASYIKAISGNAFREQVWSAIPLYSYRISLRKRLEKSFSIMVKGRKQQSKRARIKAELSDSTKIKTEPINETHSTHLISLGKNFTLNLKGFNELANVCKQKGVKLHVIFPPVTRSVPNWQNYYYPKLNYGMVMNSVKTELKGNAIAYTDYADSIPSTTMYFRDEYHLNARGAKIFSDKLIANIR